MSERTKVLVLAVGEDLVGAFRTAGASLPGVDMEIGPMRPAQVLAEAAGAPAVLALEVEAGRPGAIEAFQAFARALPDRKILAAARGADAEQVRRLFRAGAADVATSPFTAERLVASVSDLLAADGAEGGTGKVVAVIKAGGGAGATLTAVNLAVLLRGTGPGKSGAAPRSTALLDLDLQFGDAASALDLQPRSTVLDILKARERFDGRFLDGVLTAHESGLRVLAAPPAMVPTGALDAGFAETLVGRAAAAHDYTVVDLPGAWTDWTLPVLRRADLAVLVARPSVSGAARARRVLDACEEAGLATPLLLVLNGCTGVLDGMERASRIGRSLDRAVDASLALDAAAGRAADRGRAVVDAFPGSRLARELRALGRKVETQLGEDVQQPVAALNVLRPFARTARSIGGHA